MWPDNETDRDFLNFTGVADTVAEIIVQAAGRPISIGVSGAWGVGKSSMMRLVRNALIERTTSEPDRFVFVDFNAWLYQGYDDARAALMDVIATTLQAEAERRATGVEKAKELLARVNWLRAAKLAGSAAALAVGLPPLGSLDDVVELAKKASGSVDGDTMEKGAKAAEELRGLLNAKRTLPSPPKEIQALRKSFEDALSEMKITLVVLIDDLDRCLPETTISTLEAIRLFLFLKNTAFVIAADNDMIKHAVKRHFEGASEDLIVSYFDKLIQIPIRVPPLGTQEVRAYLMLLYVENSTLSQPAKDHIRHEVCKRLSETWQGKRVDRAFVAALEPLPSELIGRLDAADRLAPLMTHASGIRGNPRLVKRFLNALAIRMAIARAQGVSVEEAALAKMLLFERCGNPKAYAELISAVSEDTQGRPSVLRDWEGKSATSEPLDLPENWNDAFTLEWLRLPPRLAESDLRGILYVSREHAPLISPEDRLSSEAAELLGALLSEPTMANTLMPRLVTLTRPETTIVMDRLLERARQEEEWGVPEILQACLTVAEADPTQGARLAAFLVERPIEQVKASIVPRIGDLSWAKPVLAHWAAASGTSPAVKKAIKAQK